MTGEPAGTREFPAPKLGDRMAVKCRGHWHYGVLSTEPSWDDPEEGLKYYEINGCVLTLERVERWVREAQ